jgi:hypothetical protein
VFYDSGITYSTDVGSRSLKVQSGHGQTNSTSTWEGMPEYLILLVTVGILSIFIQLIKYAFLDEIQNMQIEIVGLLIPLTHLP